MSWQNENAAALTLSYEEVPYDGLTHSETHPSLLATVGALMGMTPAPVESCRVLEIGCAQGYNLMAMALGLPDSQFVGIDIAPGQIAAGRAALAELGVPNVCLYALDLMDVDDSLGHFDYIIAHGFFSWVPQPVRDRLLALCRQLLTPNGIAYISYNAYPGGHFMNALRDGMLFHAGRIEAPLERAEAARGWIDLLAETGEARTVPYSGFYKAYRQLIHDYREHLGDEAGRSNAGLLHDELEEVNRPFYLREFVQQVEAVGLQYLGDTEFASMLASNLPANVAEVIQRSARSRVEAEQYLDFVRNRMFRRSLICHQAVQLSGRPSMQTVESFWLSSNARAERVERPADSRPTWKYISPDGSSLSTDHPVTIAAFDYLGEVWPRRVAFADLMQEAARRVGRTNRSTDQRNSQGVAANVLKAYSISPLLIELHRHAPSLITTLSPRPVASPWARWQVRQNSRSICNLVHKRVLLDEPDSFLLLRLDGSRTLDEISQELLGGPMQEGRLFLKEKGKPGRNALPPAAQVLQSVRDRVEWFALAALLEG